jgi:DNA-binding response OmpR family regulator
MMPGHDAANTPPSNSKQNSVAATSIRQAQQTVEPDQQWSSNHSNTQYILLVEDDQTLATLEADILTAQGYKVTTVSSGELAIAEIQQAIPDLVVLDLELTGDASGWDVLHALRAYAIVPVLITTSSTTTVRTYIRTHQESKLTLDHLPKPYLMQTFLKRVKRMLLITP